jgi:beta-glucosidase
MQSPESFGTGPCSQFFSHTHMLEIRPGINRMIRFLGSFFFIFAWVTGCNTPAVDHHQEKPLPSAYESEIEKMISGMSMAEKAGQMTQLNGGSGQIPESLREAIAAGRVGSVLNEVDVEMVNELQRIAVEESRLGIPLLIGRDVIHGFKTVFPIPLGLAASWDTGLVAQGAIIAAQEAAAAGVNWTFSPMVDISRDPRWGRIAETFGEDPFLSGSMGAAMVKGYQGESLSTPGRIAACAKHFVGYGATEGGRDYNTVLLPENELRNSFMPPFKACVDAGVASFMAGFSDLNGIPPSGNEFLFRELLKKEWSFDGMVVSDWESISQLSVHGLTENDTESAFAACNAGLDMEMASKCYLDHLPTLVREGRIPESYVDDAVRRILRLKYRLGLFENPYTDPSIFPKYGNTLNLEVARKSAIKSCVLLKNKQDLLPLNISQTGTIGVVGPMADDRYEQLGTWIFDGDSNLTQTPLQAIRAQAEGKANILYAPGLKISRTKERSGFAEALSVAQRSDVVVFFAGEESILSGEAHSRADIRLPGIQEELIERLAEAGKPVVLVIMAGRPLTFERILDKVDAILYAWHPGTMGGPAISDLLFGIESPSGKLPVSFPKTVGQIPIYYSHKNSGKPPTPEQFVGIEDIPVRAKQYSLGNTVHYIDAGYTARYPFGFGLSYTNFSYNNVKATPQQGSLGDVFTFRAEVQNTGEREGEEVVQLYVRDLVGSLTRPVKELKGFQRIKLAPGETKTVEFTLHSDEFAFFGADKRIKTEPGRFQAWISGSSQTGEPVEFEIINP